MVRKLSTKKVGTKIYIWLSTAFIVCYKIKQGGFDFHMHSTSLYHPYSASVKIDNKSLPTLTIFWCMSQEPDIFCIWPCTYCGTFAIPSACIRNLSHKRYWCFRNWYCSFSQTFVEILPLLVNSIPDDKELQKWLFSIHSQIFPTVGPVL